MAKFHVPRRAVIILVFIALGSSAKAFQAAPAPAPPPPAAPAAPAGVNVNVVQMPTPIKGQPYRFSLCTGALLTADVVTVPCQPAVAVNTVAGAMQNAPIVFKLQNGSFLPPGFHLTGDGVITGDPTADVSKLSVKICALQVGAVGSNFNCQGQQVGFAGGKAAILQRPPTPAAGGGAPAGKILAAGGIAGAGTLAAMKFGMHSGPNCSSQLAALNGLASSLTGCGTSQSCYNNAINSMISKAGDLCLCMGSTPLDASDKALVTSLFSQLSALGTNPGNLPSCFR